MKRRIIYYISFGIIFILVAMYMWEIIGDKFPVSADYQGHFDSIINNDTSYSFVNIILHLLYSVGLSKNICYYLFFILIVIAKMSPALIVRYYLNYKNNKSNFCNPYLIDIVSFAILFVSGIIPIENWHEGNMYGCFGNANLWHNPTILFMQPFAILTLVFIDKYYISEEHTWKNYILLTLCITLATSIKPSFFIGIVPALAIVFIVKLIMTKGKDFKWIFITCTAFIPSLLVILYQYIVLFGGETSNGIAFTDKGIIRNDLDRQYILLVICAPLVTYLFNMKRLSLLDCSTMLYYVAGFMIGHFVTETGLRADHGNFTWTFCSAINLLFIFGSVCYLRNRKNMKIYLRAILDVLYVISLVCGFIYMARIYDTGVFI